LSARPCLDMGTHMKTTIEISDPLLAEAKALASREKTTLRALIEEGLRDVLRRKSAGKPFKLKDCSFGSGGLTPEFEAKGGWSKLREAAYPGFFDDDDDETGK
jgi:hypothetical protein